MFLFVINSYFVIFHNKTKNLNTLVKKKRIVKTKFLKHFLNKTLFASIKNTSLKQLVKKYNQVLLTTTLKFKLSR